MPSNRLLAIIATGFPGFQKLLTISIWILIWGEELAGAYSKEVAVAYFLSLITSLGFGANIMKVAPRLRRRESADLLAESAGSTLIMCTIVYAFYIVTYNVAPSLKVDYPFAVFIFLLGISFYQLLRNLYLSQKKYVKLVCADVICAFCLCGPIFFFMDVQRYLVFSSVLYLGLVISAVGFEARKLTIKISSIFEITCLQYTLNTTISGGAVVLMPKVVSMVWGNQAAANVALYISLLSVLMLPIRAYINFKIPDLSNVLHLYKDKAKQEVDSVRRNAILLALVSACVASVSMLPVSYLSDQFSFFKQINVDLSIYLAVLFFVMSSALSAADSAALFIIEKQKHSLISNAAYFVFFLIISLTADRLNAFNIVTYFYLLAISSALRAAYLTRMTNIYYGEV